MLNCFQSCGRFKIKEDRQFSVVVSSWFYLWLYMTTTARRHDGPDIALLLIGHGSRDAIGTAEFLATAELVRKAVAGTSVEPCFLEFAQPTIAEGFQSLAARGVGRIVAVPVLLFSAGHAKQDIPAALAAVAARFPQIAV